jgi:glycosyltransferase involved in cell wall biosynthesis
MLQDIELLDVKRNRDVKVLIPSDNRNFVEHWVSAYTQAGCEVVTGAFNFDLRSAYFDLVHYIFPEELCGWRPPTERRLQEISTALQWWQTRCPSIVIANNLYPNGYEGNKPFKALYELFYYHCSRILHFSSISKALVCTEFPSAQHNRHIISTPFNYVGLLAKQIGRHPCRESFGFQTSDFVILVICLLRFWEEIELITKAFSSCRVPRKQLLMAGRFENEGTRLQRKWRHFYWHLWLRCHGAAIEEDYIPDEHLYRYFDTADVVIIPRIREICSGIPNLAMTFGTMIIAPSHGVFPEYLSDTGNLLYDSGNPESLARALETAAYLDRDRIREENRAKSLYWRWDKIVTDCLHGVGLTGAVPTTGDIAFCHARVSDGR